ncbi:MAG TPA: endonuclease III [Bacteroidota bacterium]|nr:endonuclease III [Bacteroidota bacterium]
MKGKGQADLPGQRSKRAHSIESRLRKEYPSVPMALRFDNPLQLLISVILSAQCTDARVNLVTPSLFAKYKTVAAFAEAVPAELEEAIHSTGFFHNKAKNIISCCKAIREKHGGKVPSSMEELIQLPGVGRKTANCVLSGAFGITSGIIVDTHVARLANRLDLSESSNPEKVELDLCGLLEKKDWVHFSNALIHHGRKICEARKPKCTLCILSDLCPSSAA